MDRVDPVVEEAARRLGELEPEAVAMVLIGSYAKGTADEDSDLDIRAITAREPRTGYRTWFQERPGSKPLHVSAGPKTVEAWLSARERPAHWALGFPAHYVARYVWATDEARRLLGDDPSTHHPAASPELEDLVESLVKVIRSIRRNDTAGTRLYARDAAELAPRLLIPLNEERVVGDRREAMEAALTLPVAPEHYRADLEVCLGLVAAEDGAVADAALRLGRELLAFLREHKPDVDDQPGVAGYLANGTFERHLGFANE